jgi:type VI secretion system protein VasD
MLKTLTHHLALLTLLTCAFIGNGCSSSKSTVGGALHLDTDLKINFMVDANINPDENKRPSPVFLRLYELKSAATFSKSDFIDLYEHDTQILGAELVNKQTLKPLTPGAARSENFVLHSGTSQVALYAEFSQYRGSVFKIIFPVTEHNITKNEITLKISGNEISLVKK